MPPQPLRERERGHRAGRLVAVAVVLQLLAGVGAAVLLEAPSAPRDRGTAEQARVAPPVTAPGPQSEASRERRATEVRVLLAARGDAVLARDEAAFLAGIDPAAPELRERQAALFAALAEVPLSTWRYVLDPTRARPSDAGLDREYGQGRWWAPDVVLEHALTSYDARPTADAQHLTFVERDGRWWLGADDDFATRGLETDRQLWDQGPVAAVRQDDVLVLGRPSDEPLLRNVAALTAQAVPRVTAVWGEDWRRGLVVLVPGSSEELSELLDSGGDLSQIAAVATAELSGGEGEFDPTGDRVVVNRGPFARLGQLGRQVVLTHEVTHVATRRATGPSVPAWLAEGFADHVGYRGVELPLALSARGLRADVQAGRLPDRLPLDSAFDGGDPALAQAYEQSWLAVRHLVAVHGEPAVLRFYRAVGARRDVDPSAAVEQALAAELGTTTAQLTEGWRAALQRDLG